MRVLIFGTFDVLHPGHHFFVEEAMKRGNVTIVLARDHNVERIKGRRPVQSEIERRSALEAAFPNVKVVLGDADDFLAPVRAVRPDVILLGYDQKLPPGVAEKDLPCPIERLPAFHPEKYKSSLRRGVVSPRNQKPNRER